MKLDGLGPKLGIGVISLILAVPINASVFGLLVSPNTAEIVFESKLQAPIQSIEVQLCSETKRLSSVDPGVTASLKFDVSGDCHYSIKALMADNRTLDANFGYVTAGSNYKDTVVIEQNQLIEGKQSVEPDPNYLAKTVGLFLVYFLIVVVLFNILLFLLRKLRQVRA